MYPPATPLDVVDDYHGTRVADPYRWLEDADAPETVRWVEAQNQLVRSVLDGPARDEIRARLAALVDFPRTEVPEVRGTRHVFAHNDGLQNQPVVFWCDGADGDWHPLLDPNTLSPDGTAAVTGTWLDEAGTHLAYAVSDRGSDRQEIRVRHVETGRDLPDRLLWAKFASLAWLSDGSGFYYTRFPEPGTVPPGEEHYGNRVCLHRLGAPQETDEVVFAHPTDRHVVFTVDLADADRLLVLGAALGASDKGELYLLDRSAPSTSPLAVFKGFDDAWLPIDSVGRTLYLLTDADAPNRRIVALHVPEALVADEAPDAGTGQRPALAGAALEEVVPESADRLESAVVVNGHLVASYLRNASADLRLFDLQGTPRDPVPLPSIGTVATLGGRPSGTALYFGFSSFTHPATPMRYDFSGRAPSPWGRTGMPGVRPDEYDVSQVWYDSKDGTRVSMFLVHHTGLARDGQRPTLLYGYGGFDISLTPSFDPMLFAWLERGGVYAVPNLRGGGEYGEQWHRAGMLERKQNVFDDCIAAAEWLVAQGYTSPRRLAIEGGSNGGLLTGAVLTQRPDLVGAVLCEVPVVDMLRYHRFTVGRFWIPEYGSSDDPGQFPFLLAYSPLHNVEDGVAYPATLITTADTDDRVAPGMAKKFAARLQAATEGPAPILIRVETRAGHGAGKPIAKLIDEQADLYAFLAIALCL